MAISNPINPAVQVEQGARSLPTSAAQPKVSSSGYRGAAVVHSQDPIAQLFDAAEELTFAHSEKVEKDLAKRKISGKSDIKTFAMEQAEKYLEQVADLERDKKLSEFAKEILELEEKGGAQTPESLRQQAKQFSGDETHQFLALTYAHEQALNSGAPPELTASLEQAIGQLQDESGPAIQAGINVTGVAHEFSAKGVGDTQELRDLYRFTILDYDNLQQAYGNIVEKYVDEDFPGAVNFLLKSLAADLDATNASVSKTQLKQIIDDMYQLKVLNSVHEQCGDLISRVQNNYSPAAGQVGAHDLMQELIIAQDKGWQGERLFAELPHKMGINGSDAEIYFLQGFKEIVRLIPPKVFDDDVRRDRLLQSVQQTLDTVIDNELADG